MYWLAGMLWGEPDCCASETNCWYSEHSQQIVNEILQDRIHRIDNEILQDLLHFCASTKQFEHVRLISTSVRKSCEHVTTADRELTINQDENLPAKVTILACIRPPELAAFYLEEENSRPYCKCTHTHKDNRDWDHYFDSKSNQLAWLRSQAYLLHVPELKKVKASMANLRPSTSCSSSSAARGYFPVPPNASW